MEDLIALAKVVNKQKIKQIDIISEENSLSEKGKLFYQGLASGKIKSDYEAVMEIYNEEIISSKYRKLKKRLRDKLINTLFFIDVQQFSRNDYDQHLVKCYMMLSAIKILINKGFIQASAKLSEEVLVKAIKYDLTDLAYLLTSELSQYYTVFNFSKSKSQHYYDMELQYAELFRLERSSKSIFTYFAFFINQNKEYRTADIPDKINNDLRIVKENIGSIDSYYFNLQSRNALYFKSYLENDFQQIMLIAQEAVEFFKTKKGFSKIGEFSFLQKLGIAKQALKKYKEAINVYHEAFKLNPRSGSISWYNIRNHLFNSHLHLKQYQEAYNYLLEATTHPSFRKLYELYREPWLIKEAYMHLLIKMGKVRVENDNDNNLRPFRISRFINEVALFSKDKRGLNIAVNIVHALFLFLQRDEDALEKRLDALGQYSFRYLRNDETLRSNAFIKMLQKLPDAGFHPIRLKRYTEKYYKRLIEAPMIIAENSKEVEIIPYEHLWEIVIELLEMRLAKKL